MVNLTIRNGQLMCGDTPCERNMYNCYGVSETQNGDVCILNTKLRTFGSVCNSVVIYKEDDISVEAYGNGTRTYYKLFDIVASRYISVNDATIIDVTYIDDGKYIAKVSKDRKIRWHLIYRTETEWSCSQPYSYEIEKCGDYLRVKKLKSGYKLDTFENIKDNTLGSNKELYEIILYNPEKCLFEASKNGRKYFRTAESDSEFYPPYKESEFTDFKFFDRVYIGTIKRAGYTHYEFGEYNNHKHIIPLDNKPQEITGGFLLTTDENQVIFDPRADRWEDVFPQAEAQESMCQVIFIDGGEDWRRLDNGHYAYKRRADFRYNNLILLDTASNKVCYCQCSIGRNRSRFDIKVESKIDENYDLLRFSRKFQPGIYEVDSFNPIVNNGELNYNDIVCRLKKRDEYKKIAEQNRLVNGVISFCDKYTSYGISEDAMLSNVLGLYNLDCIDEGCGSRSQLDILKEELSDGEINFSNENQQQLSEIIDDFAKEVSLNEDEKEFLKDFKVFAKYQSMIVEIDNYNFMNALERLNPSDEEHKRCQQSLIDKYKEYCKKKDSQRKRKNDDLRKNQAKELIDFLKRIKENHLESFANDQQNDIVQNVPMVSNVSNPEKNDVTPMKTEPHKSTKKVKNPTKGLKVTFADGSIVWEKSAIDTLIKTLRIIGFERVSKVENTMHAGYPLVSQEMRPTEPGRIWQRKCDEWYIYSYTSNERKIADLRKISDFYNLNLKIEEVKPK